MTTINWDDRKVSNLKMLTYRGFNSTEISTLMSDHYKEYFSPKAVGQAKNRYKVLTYCLERDKDIRLYTDTLRLPRDNYIVFCDFHSPYHSELWMNRGLAIADNLDIKKCIIAGDLIDNDFIKSWENMDIADQTTLDQQTEGTRPVFEALDYFDQVTLIRGNHETRVNRATDGKIHARHLFEIIGKEIWENKFSYSTYDKLFIGDEWMIVHPRSYSQISGSVAVRLAEKFHRHVLNAHGHFLAMKYDRSGEYMSIDLGGMYDVQKIGYINKFTTTHPCWNNGFAVVTTDDEIHLFHENTDWHYYGVD